MTDREDPVVTSLADAARWIAVHHRYAIQDAERMDRIEDRLRRLESDRWSRLMRMFRR